MTKQELRTRLINLGFQIKTDKETGQLLDYTYYDLKVLKREGIVLKEKNLKIAVDKSGNAFWGDQDPEIFRTELLDYLESEKLKGNIEGSHVNYMNSDEETAEVTLWQYGEKNKIVRNRFFINKNQVGNIQKQKM